ncbi:glucan biosynthesis protein [Devosia chinhatensis]|uniref:Glucan biosynthesis protein D n=1 Tax=Devosia chinhatensis TaxID=429727 RepID=A0A0F5FG05_9HYPH|nr:glucan biosynthesis protein G [Devosia chinhatensis]KKB07718.1 glucan biosynthesis protein D [Devosia chinhatensis]
MTRPQYSLPNRRTVLAGLGFTLFLATTTSLSRPILAQQADGFAFDFDSFSERLKLLAAEPHAPLTVEIPQAFQNLDYDAYRLIQYRGEASKWADNPGAYRLQAFHLGWLYTEPVKVFEIEAGTARSLDFAAADFDYHNNTVGEAAAAVPFPGIAGLRVNYPLNRADALDELVSFLGASYFRALGRDNIYGASARGLLLNSWIDIPEEFPRFSEFYVEKPTAADAPLVVYAALESPSVTGAYRFVITPAGEAQQESVMDVTARLFFRTDIKEIGIAPLTSMFLYAEANRGGFDDYRPQVHDSNGLLVERESGEVLWRALNNSAWLGNSYLAETNPKAFGLYQRGRDFETYQDAGAHYERRPSVRIEPLEPWGQGMVRLIEIPARLEADDNIVAFWIPAEPAKAGEDREYRYRVIWGDLDPDASAPMAHVAETRAGVGGVSGVENEASLRKFVVDFKGGELETLPAGTPIDVLATVGGGVMRNSVLSRVDANGAWRLVMDVETEDGATLELKAYLVGLGRKLTETWLYQWRPAA